MARRIGHFLRKWYTVGATTVVIPPSPSSYYPQMNFSDARNSMYSQGGF